MTDVAAAKQLVESLVQLVTYHVKLISGVRGEVDQLIDDLNYLNSFLKYVSMKKIEDELALECVRQLRDAVHDADNSVDAFVTLTLSSTTKNWFSRPFSNMGKIDQIAQQVIKVRQRVEGKYGEIMRTLETINNGDDAADEETKREAQVFPLREKRVVDVKDKADTIIRYLKEDKEYSDIISIVGPPGLGKSTLAGNIFRHPIIEEEFPKRIWVNVSKYTPKELFISILKEVMTDTTEGGGEWARTDNKKDHIGGRGKFSRVVISKMQSMNERVLGITKVQDDGHHLERGNFSYNKMRKMRESELEELVKGHLERGKFLIVMDDVWMGDDWKKISNALPTSNKHCKILVTSRERVALSPNKDREPLDMRPLSKEESIQLLQYEVFGEKTWKPEFEDRGVTIAEKCKGLPLAIVVMGGIIQKKLSLIKDYAAKVNAWNAFSEKVEEYLSDDSEGIMEKVISLSYDRLPYHLRACFLYFGMFPEDAKIPTWKLFQMWIAEGFIPENTHFTKEETAESYLDELIIRSLVTVDKTSFDGKVKLVCIHDSLRDFCLKKAGRDRERFLEEIRELHDGSLKPLVKNDNEYRRLTIHSNISKFLSSKPSGRRVRSFVCSSKGQYSALKEKHVSAIPKGFKVLRILDVNPIRFSKIPSDMYDLLHLRYIHLSFNSKTLPASFSKLWNIQTLIVNTSRRTLEIKADIWKMRHLKNLKTNATTNLPKVTEADEDCRNNMQTLGKIAPENCTSEVLDRACNLRRVSIRGNLNVLRAGTIDDGCLFDNMVKMSKLEELKLENDVFPLPPSECPLRYLPPADTFPPNLTKLTLAATYLNWSQMRVLAFLDNLKVLKLKERAFAGNFWETVGGFKSLQVLFIGRTDLVIWRSSVGHFPALVRLELQNCEDLRELPIELAEIRSFNAMLLNHCPTAVAAAEEIERQKRQTTEEADDDETTEFKLTILPLSDK